MDDALWKLEMLTLPPESEEFIKLQQAQNELMASNLAVPLTMLEGGFNLAIALEHLELLRQAYNKSLHANTNPGAKSTKQA